MSKKKRFCSWCGERLQAKMVYRGFDEYTGKRILDTEWGCSCSCGGKALKKLLKESSFPRL